MGGEVVCDDDRALTCDLARVVGATVAPKERPVFPILREAYLAPGGKDRAGEELGFDGVGGGGVADCAPFHPLPHAKPFQQWRSVMSDSRQSPLLPVGEWHQPQAPEGARRPGGARRGPVITGVVNRLALAAVLITGLTVTACSAASAPASNGGSGAAAPAGQGNSAAAAPAGQSGEDPGCQAIASQASGINSQISADSGNYSAQIQVWQAWYNDLQAARQETQNGTVAGALGDTASGVEKVILDEQNLLDDPNSDFSQLDSDTSAYEADVSILDTACGFPS